MSGFSNAGGFANTTTFHDKMVYDPLHYKKKRGASHAVGVEVEAITPDADEIRLLGNRHRDCSYYQIGVELCHTAMLR